MTTRRAVLGAGLGATAALTGCGGGGSDTQPDDPSTIRATGWTQMPAAFYTNIPEANEGSFATVGGYPAFDMADPDFMGQIGWPSALPQPGDQGSQPSCTAWAVGYAAATTAVRYSGVALNSAISPADLFAKLLRRTPGACTQGSYISYAMDTLVQEGVTTIDLSPYSPQQCGLASSARVYNLDGFSRVSANDSVAIRASVTALQPVSFGMQVSNAISNVSVSNPIFRPNGTGGGHAMTIVGFDDVRQLYKVVNSWSTSWGVNGFLYISYADFAAHARDVCIPYLRRVRDNAILSATSTLPGNPIVAQHMRATLYGAATIGYGVGVEMGWSAPMDIRMTTIEVLNTNLVVIYRQEFSVSQIARGVRFGCLLTPAAASGLFQVRSSVTGYDAFGTLLTLFSRTQPYQR